MKNPIESNKALQKKLISEGVTTIKNHSQIDKNIIASDRLTIEYLENEIQIFRPTLEYLENKSGGAFIGHKRSTHYTTAAIAISRYIIQLKQKITDIKDKHGWL